MLIIFMVIVPAMPRGLISGPLRKMLEFNAKVARGAEEMLASCEGLGGEVGKMLNAFTISLTI
jgi:hypothetical protein